MRRRGHRQEDRSSSLGAMYNVSTSCSVAFATCTWISHHNNEWFFSLWRCIRNRQWYGRIYSSSKRFKIFVYIVQNLLQALLVLVRYAHASALTREWAVPCSRWCWRWLAWSPVHALDSWQKIDGRNVMQIDCPSIRHHFQGMTLITTKMYSFLLSPSRQWVFKFMELLR